MKHRKESRTSAPKWKAARDAISCTDLDERVELLVTANRELKVARGDALDLEVLGRVTGKLENLGRQVPAATGKHEMA